MRVLVTGGLGYLGSHISSHFLDRGCLVRILSRTPHPELSAWSRQFEVVTGDVAEYGSIEDCCRDMDVVIHAAALNEVECRVRHKEALLINGYGTRNLLEDASKNRVSRFIYLSTFHVYGVPEKGIITEETLPDPVNSYSISHHLAEGYCRQFEAEGKVRSHILRISNGYGAPLFKSVNRWSLVVNDLCLNAFKQKKIVLKSKGTQERDFVAIRDILNGLDVFADGDVVKDGSNIYNLGGGESLSIIAVANLVAEVFRERYGRSIPVEVPAHSGKPDTGVKFQFSIDKIQRLGYRPMADMKAEIGNIFGLLES